MIEIKDGTLRVSATYSLKVPVNDGGYAMQDAGMSMTVEQTVGDTDTARVAKDALSLYEQLIGGCKLAVFGQLGVDFDTTNDGVMKPKVTETPKSSGGGRSNAARTGGGNRSGSGGQRQGSGGGRQFAPAKAAGRELPVVTFGGGAYYDQRPLKLDGTYKPGAADFKSVQKRADGTQAQVWLFDKNGNLNEEVADQLDEAGILWGDAYDTAAAPY